MHKWGILAVGLCVGGVLFAALTRRVAAEPAAELCITEPATIELPCAVADTQLVILETAVYEGPYWEDGSGEEVANVLALVVENTGGTMILQGQILLKTERGILEFSVSWLPPDEAVLVLEKNRASAGDCEIYSCSGWNTTIYPEMTGAVTAGEQGMGELTFVNHTTQPIAEVEAVYKTYDPESKMFLGGRAETVILQNLQPGEKRTVSPYRYAKGYSKVVSILLTGFQD